MWISQEDARIGKGKKKNLEITFSGNGINHKLVEVLNHFFQGRHLHKKITERKYESHVQKIV